MGVLDDGERVEPATLDEWSAWLASHHADTPGVWLVSARRAAAREFGYEAAVLEALRYGWVDSTQRPLDAERSMQWFAPRRPGSVWTRRNKERIASLEASGRLEESGRAAVDAAKASGMWTLMDDVEDLVVPDDLAEAFARHDGSRAHWDGFPPSARKAMLGWIVLAKRAETREVRVAQVAECAGRGERAR